MNTEEIIRFIQTAQKKTPVKVYLNTTRKLNFPNAKVFGTDTSMTVFGDWDAVAEVLAANQDAVVEFVCECDRRNSGVPLLDLRALKARIEPGAIIRDHVEIGENAVVMMGAVVNIGAVIGAGSMIDMGAVLGGRATVGERCHIGAGAVLAGVVEPASAKPVIMEDDVLVGANAVVLEGIHIGAGSVVAAGAVVVEDVPAGVVVAGCPARVIKQKDKQTEEKTAIIEALRSLD